MRRTMNFIGRALLVAILGWLPWSAASAETVLRAIAYVPPSKIEDSMAIFKMWIDKVNTAGKGDVRIELIGGPEVFPISDQINALSKGLVDIVMTFTVHTPLVPEVDTSGLSDITPTEERQNGYFELLDKAHEKINVKVIGRTATNSGFYIFSKQPINKLADFKNMKIRSHSGYDPLFRQVGAVPIGMNIAEIYGALERGIVTAAPYNIFVYDMGLQEVVKYGLADPFWPSYTTFTFMNLKKFRGLTPKQKAILTDAQLEIEKDMAAIEAKLIGEERAKLEKSGITFTHLSPDEAKQWRQMANNSRFETLASKLGAEQTAKIRALISRD
ncbi:MULTISPECIES: TRAP transporter substrate-binding protein DctP [unclassified Beijerinckia]|uniref:TRAP transporter substrate-binding protein DctP n=1 Tax=unclassified Beijerinckia TaxID=2638183 RepID=UPI000897235E|nr:MULTISPECIES: TRAP transporter substrate-binding protein DctP [unclassified Beijerinckia]MDH7799229.1 TRAP-type C4-dicarboxylate transport system substrate-binding protein [Beijerinckia sp. GAS462]SED91323.1 TRAP-type C4-dicarboxylate transport system, substrate-binding protein [Beijerinckia sp. 28-YEA-48]